MIGYLHSLCKGDAAKAISKVFQQDINFIYL